MLARVVAALIVVVAVLAGAAPAAAAATGERPRVLVIATGSPGGTYFAFGQALAKLLSNALDLPVIALPSEGSRETIQKIENGDAQLGFVTMGVALEAWNGSGDWTNGRRYRAMRALFPMYEGAFQFVTLADTPIRSLADTSGRRIGVGPKAGTTALYVPRFLSTLDIDARIVHGAWNEVVAQMERGDIDVLAVAGNVPFAAINDLAAKHKIAYVTPTREELLRLRLAFPELTAAVLPPGSYPSLLTPYQTVGVYNFAVGSRDLPDDLAYAIVNAVFTHHAELVDADPAAAATIPENFVHNTFLPFHPGALRFYADTGGASVLEKAVDAFKSFTVTVGTFRVSPLTVLTGLLWLALLLWVASWAARLFEARVLAHSRLTHSVQLLFSRMTKVVLITAAVFIALGMMGIDLTAFAVFTGAVGVGIGFGLQAIFNNFVAGLILLSEKSLKVGDFVDLADGLAGTVRQINIRNTTITTPLNIDVVVPNSEFVNGRVTNWTMLEPHARMRIPFAVAYGTDLDFLREVLLAAADEVPYTLQEDEARKTQLWLLKFGESRLECELVVWLTADGIHRPTGAHAAYCWAIYQTLRTHGIEIPLPQRDLHLRSAVPIRIDETRPGPE
jgi:TRAP transporter solute receptor, TAXI family